MLQELVCFYKLLYEALFKMKNTIRVRCSTLNTYGFFEILIHFKFSEEVYLRSSTLIQTLWSLERQKTQALPQADLLLKSLRTNLGK